MGRQTAKAGRWQNGDEATDGTCGNGRTLAPELRIRNSDQGRATRMQRGSEKRENSRVFTETNVGAKNSSKNYSVFFGRGRIV